MVNHVPLWQTYVSKIQHYPYISLQPEQCYRFSSLNFNTPVYQNNWRRKNIQRNQKTKKSASVKILRKKEMHQILETKQKANVEGLSILDFTR